MSAGNEIRCECSGPPEPLTEKSFLTFYEDDYLIRFEQEQDAATLWCFTRYGSQPVEMNFEGVTDVKVDSNFNAAAPWDGYGYKIKKNSDGTLTITFDESELLRITFREAWIKPCSLIQIGHHEFRDRKSQRTELNPKYVWLVLAIGTLLFLLFAYLRA